MSMALLEETWMRTVWWGNSEGIVECDASAGLDAGIGCGVGANLGVSNGSMFKNALCAAMLHKKIGTDGHKSYKSNI
jgi:hypothetical protein